MAGPKLLDKKLVSAELATQRKREIDQGVAIAKKVDALRETLQEEEKRLETFRTQSIARVQQEIDAKIKEREAEERKLQSVRTRIESEMEALHEREIEVTKREAVVEERFKLLNTIISELE